MVTCPPDEWVSPIAVILQDYENPAVAAEFIRELMETRFNVQFLGSTASIWIYLLVEKWRTKIPRDVHGQAWCIAARFWGLYQATEKRR